MEGFLLLKDDVEEIDPMQTDTQNYSLPPINNGISNESIDNQNTLTSNNVRRRRRRLVF